MVNDLNCPERLPFDLFGEILVLASDDDALCILQWEMVSKKWRSTLAYEQNENHQFWFKLIQQHFPHATAQILARRNKAFKIDSFSRATFLRLLKYSRHVAQSGCFSTPTVVPLPTDFQMKINESSPAVGENPVLKNKWHYHYGWGFAVVYAAAEVYGDSTATKEVLLYDLDVTSKKQDLAAKMRVNEPESAILYRLKCPEMVTGAVIGKNGKLVISMTKRLDNSSRKIFRRRYKNNIIEMDMVEIQIMMVDLSRLGSTYSDYSPGEGHLILKPDIVKSDAVLFTRIAGPFSSDDLTNNGIKDSEEFKRLFQDLNNEGIIALFPELPPLLATDGVIVAFSGSMLVQVSTWQFPDSGISKTNIDDPPLPLANFSPSSEWSEGYICEEHARDDWIHDFLLSYQSGLEPSSARAHLYVSTLPSPGPEQNKCYTRNTAVIAFADVKDPYMPYYRELHNNTMLADAKTGEQYNVSVDRNIAKEYQSAKSTGFTVHSARVHIAHTPSGFGQHSNIVTPYIRIQENGDGFNPQPPLDSDSLFLLRLAPSTESNYQGYQLAYACTYIPGVSAQRVFKRNDVNQYLEAFVWLPKSLAKPKDYFDVLDPDALLGLQEGVEFYFVVDQNDDGNESLQIHGCKSKSDNTGFSRSLSYSLDLDKLESPLERINWIQADEWFIVFGADLIIENRKQGVLYICRYNTRESYFEDREEEHCVIDREPERLIVEVQIFLDT